MLKNPTHNLDFMCSQKCNDVALTLDSGKNGGANDFPSPLSFLCIMADGGGNDPWFLLVLERR